MAQLAVQRLIVLLNNECGELNRATCTYDCGLRGCCLMVFEVNLSRDGLAEPLCFADWFTTS